MILLAKCDVLATLAVQTPLVMPAEVEKEALAEPALYDAKVIAALLEKGALRTLRVKDPVLRRRVQEDFGLGRGEAEALVSAKEQETPLATDDGPAIKAAKIMGIPFVTAIHVVVELQRRGRIARDCALSKVELLERIGRYNRRILEDARRRILEGG